MTTRDDYMPLFTGYAIDKEDREGLAATSVVARTMQSQDVPDRVDPRRHPLATKGWLRVEDQGSIGSCQGQSLTECAEYSWVIGGGEVIQLSRMFAYLVSQYYDKITGDRGSTLSGGTRAIQEVGCCEETIAPYPSSYPGQRWVTDAMKAAAGQHKMQTHTVIRTCDEVRRFIGSGIGIVQIGIAWGRAMTPDRNGLIRSFAPGGGGHAVVFCGYVPDSDINQKSSRGYWLLLKNSWSVRWGIGGYCYVDPAAVDQMLAHRWTVFVGRSDMETPEPRPLPVDFTKPGNSLYQ